MSYLLQSVDGIVFDFNGTLFEDGRENRESWDRISLEIRGKALSDEEFSRYNGRTDRDMVRFFLPGCSDSEADRWSERKEELYKALCIERGLTLRNGSYEIFSKARDMGIRIAIASSAPRMNMDWYIPRFRLLDYFGRSEIIAGRDDIPSKPDGAIFRLALDAIGVSGCHAAAFEDSRAGVLSAMDAGIRTVMRMRDPEAKPLDIPGIIEIRSFSEISLQ